MTNESAYMTKAEKEFSEDGFKVNKAQTALTTLAVGSLFGGISYISSKSVVWTVVGVAVGCSVGFIVDSQIQKKLK